MKMIPAAIAVVILLAGCNQPEEQDLDGPVVQEAWARGFLNATRVLEEPMVRAERNATAAAEAFHYGRAGRAYDNASFRAEAGAVWAQGNATPQYGHDLQDAVVAYYNAALYYFDGAASCYASRAAGSPPPPVCDELEDRNAERDAAYEAMLDEYVELVPRRLT